MTEITERYTSGSYGTANVGWHQEDSSWKAGQIQRILERNSIKPRSFVEVGCGAGGILSWLAKSHREALLSGYDISPQAIKLAERYQAENVKFFCKDFLTERTDVCDMLLAIDVVEHIPNYIGFLEALRDRARAFAFHIPLELHVQAVLRDTQILTRDAFGHLHYFSKATVLRTLEDTGYKVVDWFYTPVALQSQSGQRTWKREIANIPRRLCFPLAPDLTTKILGGYSIMVLATAGGRDS